MIDGINSIVKTLRRWSKRTRRIVAFAAFTVAGIAFYYWENETIQVETFVCECPKIPRSFDGFKIVQISDLHNKDFGRDNCRLLAKIRAENPNIIAITGDLTQEPVLDVEFAANFVANAQKIAPVYYVSGNHETCVNLETQYFPFVQALKEKGANVLRCETKEFSNGTDSILLAGIDDPTLAFQLRQDGNDSNDPPLREDGEASIVADSLKKLNLSDKKYAVLLSHRPEFPELYSNAGVDLALVGHAHGGQIRIPFIGGLYAPNQGVFPPYSAGLYRVGSTTEIVSNGLGPSAFPMRIFNRPRLVVCVLKSCE